MTDEPATEVVKDARFMERAKRKAEAADLPWERKGERGGIVSDSVDNVRVALSALGVKLRYDEFNGYILISGPGDEPERYLDDKALKTLWVRVREYLDFKPSLEFFDTTVEVIGLEAANRFHPVRDYLATLKWDGTPRLDTWLVKYGGAPDTEYVRAVGSKAIIAAVRRVRHPGCKFDCMLVLHSGQGTFKSSALKALAGGDAWFTDTLPVDADARVVIEQTRGKWIVELAELAGLKRAEVEHVKATLSRQQDRARAVWGRRAEDVPRQCVFFGTTNAERFLTDPTGNRRFWPVRVERFDADALKRDRDQLWAEAAAREEGGEEIFLAPGLEAAAAGEQEERRQADPWEMVIATAIGEMKGSLPVEYAWAIVGHADPRQRTADHQRRLGQAMERLGWEHWQMRRNGKPLYVYRPKGGQPDGPKILLKVVRTSSGELARDPDSGTAAVRASAVTDKPRRRSPF